MVRLDAVPRHRLAGNSGPLALSGFSYVWEADSWSEEAGGEETDIPGCTGSDLPHGG